MIVEIKEDENLEELVNERIGMLEEVGWKATGLILQRFSRVLVLKFDKANREG
jgi:hypothetical protein